jgi:hypothetical protein
MKKLLSIACMVLGLSLPAFGGVLFVGLEGSAPPTKSSDLSGFPNVSWNTHFSIDANGAAATPEGDIYISQGSFDADLYRATLETAPVFIAALDIDVYGLAYGRDMLYAFSNYSDPKGIYSIDPNTGATAFVLDVYSGPGFRFFALDYNPADDLFYGYTYFGDSGLYSINIDTGEMIKIVTTIPASNSQGCGLAVGNNVVYLTGTRGDDGIPFYAYDLAQGVGGEWLPFTNAYPTYHSQGSAAWIPPASAVGEAPSVAPRMSAWPNPFNPRTSVRVEMPSDGTLELVVYSALGQRVATIFEGQVAAGSHDFIWNAKDDAGRQVSGGVYQWSMVTNGYSETLKLVLLK